MDSCNHPPSHHKHWEERGSWGGGGVPLCDMLP